MTNKITTFPCRADMIRLGDVIAASQWRGISFPAERVTRLDLIGDDVVINDTITTSRNNLITLMLRKGNQ
jgi:hypothetical protein